MHERYRTAYTGHPASASSAQRRPGHLREHGRAGLKVTIHLEMAKNHLQLLGTPKELDRYLLQVLFPLEVTTVQAGVLHLLTHCASNFHMEHVFQPSDNLEKIVSFFKVRAWKRDARILAKN